jgi:hydroxymethylpyrimidine kinase/phosphomethylpyrimidine kinase
MISQKKLPVALTIAGSDSGGGAGIQADLKTFAALGVHGTSVIACLTAQNPKRVLEVEPVSAKMLRQQLEAVFEEIPPSAVKTGMLYSAKNIGVVAGFFQRLRGWRGPLVVDPVLVSTSGTRLLEPKGMKALREKLLPLASLVTPNVSEAQILSGEKISTVEEMEMAARAIHSEFGCAVLVKGGHLRNSKMATDVYFDGRNKFILSARFVKGVRTHGTGCVYSAAICGALALGKDMPQAVRLGKKFVTGAIAGSYRMGKHWGLGI